MQLPEGGMRRVKGPSGRAVGEEEFKYQCL